ncbi:Rieske (2Fe-2S) protein [Spirosoma taeanense]|uniref:Rieske (2Fe-2S) protein n=1 Tax=Spirosoma taeanense TaxID=2735870 RepID=A0A6M5Y7S5_9BACT|nr:Rieske (2Fe-2S) protein [Spirosoma taeanense]QJW90398.1 Rieske (2Fe-2S) protein [Spirosoma taeanense]
METILPASDGPTMPRHEFFRLVGTSVGTILLARCMAGCANDGAGDPNPSPEQAVDFVINLDEKVNENLKLKGGYVIIKNIIIAQTKDGQFVAVSAKCTHQGTQLVYKPTENQFYCPLHLSRFDITGKVVTGPASQPLIRYAVATLTNGTLRIQTMP